MSNIAIKGATTGIGTFTLEAPATSTNRTLTLPDEAGTVLTSASNIVSLIGAGTLSLSTLSQAYGANGYMDIGNVRINWLTTTTAATAGSGAAPGPGFTVGGLLTYTAAFKTGTLPVVFASLVTNYHDTSHPGVSTASFSNTQMQYIFACYRAAGIESRKVCVVAIGEKP